MKKNPIIMMDGDPYQMVIPWAKQVSHAERLLPNPAVFDKCLVKSPVTSHNGQEIRGQMIYTNHVVVDTGYFAKEMKKKQSWCVEGNQWYIPTLIPLLDGKPCLDHPLNKTGEITEGGTLRVNGDPIMLRYNPFVMEENHCMKQVDTFSISDSLVEECNIQWIWMDGYMLAINCAVYLNEKLYKAIM